ncbi:hypothetical protein MMC31_001239 [Peltigera leucophlebia]|nr:hypothetical protein [Peltigera leucophlebia]
MSDIQLPPFPVEVSLNQYSSQQLQREQKPRNINPASSLDSRPSELTLPAVYHDKTGKLQEINCTGNESLPKYLQHELDLSRLDGIHHHLWLAGRPVCARALHRQLMIGREIIITEQADFHLVWRDSRIYLKPLPEFLLNSEFWAEHLCKDDALWQSARGFLLSYLWLVCSKNDLQIAQDKGLLPPKISWDSWVRFSSSILKFIDIASPESVDRRFLYGELRLNRLNWIYRIFSLPHNPKNFILGYMSGYNRYSVFLERNFAWIIGAFVYVTIVLTAMQVGLATDRLKNNERFQDASYGFTVFAILSPILAFGILAILLIVLVFFHLWEALKHKKKKSDRTSTNTGNSTAV